MIDADTLTIILTGTLLVPFATALTLGLLLWLMTKD